MPYYEPQIQVFHKLLGKLKRILLAIKALATAQWKGQRGVGGRNLISKVALQVVSQLCLPTKVPLAAGDGCLHRLCFWGLITQSEQIWIIWGLMCSSKQILHFFLYPWCHLNKGLVQKEMARRREGILWVTSEVEEERKGDGIIITYFLPNIGPSRRVVLSPSWRRRISKCKQCKQNRIFLKFLSKPKGLIFEISHQASWPIFGGINCTCVYVWQFQQDPWTFGKVPQPPEWEDTL